LRVAFTPALCLCLLFSAGCAVTDTIEFEDAVNSPPMVISSTPRGLSLAVYADGDQTFSVVIQDPDEDDANNTDVAARLFLNNAYFNNRAYPCNPPREPPPLIGSPDDPSAGALIYIACTLQSGNLQDIPAGVQTEVTLEVSDLGYSAGNTVREGAHTVEVNWILEVEQ
jgi:hypothetical protein